MRRPRRVAVALAVPLAAALVGSYLVTQSGGASTVGAQQHQAEQLQAVSALAGVLHGLSNGSPDGGTGGEDALADLAAAQDVAFSSSRRPKVDSSGSAQQGTNRAAAGSHDVRQPFAGAGPVRIRAAAVAATKAARSLHVRGVVRSDGAKQTVDLEISVHVAGGTVSDGKGRMQLRRLGRAIYYQGDDVFWATHGLEKSVDQLRDKWIKVMPNAAGYQDLARITHAATWADQVISSSSAVGRKPGVVLGGVPTVVIFGGHGPGAESLYVAATGPAYPLYWATQDKTSHLAYFGWNHDVFVDEPAVADLLEPSAA